MRSTHGWLEVCAGAIFLAAIAAASGDTRATPQVVGDEACERYAVDIASFATCVDGRVTLPEREPAQPPSAGRPGDRAVGGASLPSSPPPRDRRHAPNDRVPRGRG